MVIASLMHIACLHTVDTCLFSTSNAGWVIRDGSLGICLSFLVRAFGGQENWHDPFKRMDTCRDKSQKERNHAERSCWDTAHAEQSWRKKKQRCVWSIRNPRIFHSCFCFDSLHSQVILHYERNPAALITVPPFRFLAFWREITASRPNRYRYRSPTIKGLRFHHSHLHKTEMQNEMIMFWKHLLKSVIMLDFSHIYHRLGTKVQTSIWIHSVAHINTWMEVSGTADICLKTCKHSKTLTSAVFYAKQILTEFYSIESLKHTAVTMQVIIHIWIQQCFIWWSKLEFTGKRNQTSRLD